MARQKLTSLTEISPFFRTNQTPIYFVTPAPYNLLGIDQWVGSFEYITYFDSFDGYHPRCFTPDRSRCARVQVDGGRRQLPARPQGDRRPGQGPRRQGQGAADHVRRDQRGAGQGAGPGDGAAAGQAAHAHRLQDRHHPARQRRRRAQRAQRAGPGQGLRRAARARRTSTSWATIWWCRRPTAIPGAPPSSSSPRPTGTSTPTAWPTKSSRSCATSTTCRARSRAAPPATARWSARS